jgi:plasmid maintenance system antidote protein VapI
MSKPYFDLESAEWTADSLTFRELQRRLLMYVVRRIRNGEFTERGLARILDVSQPQLHNVLKGARPLRPEFADRLLEHFKIGVLDLVGVQELGIQAKAHQDAAETLWPDVPGDSGTHPMSNVGNMKKGPRRQFCPFGRGRHETG